MFEHTVGDTEFKVEIVASERCKGCIAMEGTKVECMKLWAKVGSCFAVNRRDQTEVVFKQHRTHYRRDDDDEEGDNDEE